VHITGIGHLSELIPLFGSARNTEPVRLGKGRHG
jgi:hypothetical protein